MGLFGFRRRNRRKLSKLFGLRRGHYDGDFRLDLAYEPIAPFGKCRDVFRIFRWGPESLAKLVYGGGETVLEVHESICRPQFAADFVTGHDFAGIAKQHTQQLKWLGP